MNQYKTGSEVMQMAELMIDKPWQRWVEENVQRGCDKQQLFEIMLEHGFHPQAIYEALMPMEITDRLKKRLIAYGYHIDQKNNHCQFRHMASLSESTFNTSKKVPTDQARIYIHEDFLDAQQCQEVVKRINQNLRPSTITSSDEPDQYFRTSKTCDLGIHGDDLIKQVDQKIVDYLGYDAACSEVLQGQYYQVGDEFKLHTDYFKPNSEEYRKFATKQGQRTWTLMIYLNEVVQGGHTDFPKLDLSVKPKTGMAVIWNNIDNAGLVNPATAHWAKPIIQGEKYVITKWFRQRAV